MINLINYSLGEDDIEFIGRINEDIQNQNEIVLQYQNNAFCIDPSGEELTVTDYTGTVGEYVGFDDLFLNHIINNKPLIELVQELEYGE
jgi:hypothetical protein